MQTESLFAENYEHFFNGIDPKRTLADAVGGEIYVCHFASLAGPRRRTVGMRSGVVLRVVEQLQHNELSEWPD